MINKPQLTQQGNLESPYCLQHNKRYSYKPYHFLKLTKASVEHKDLASKESVIFDTVSRGFQAL